MNKLLLLLNLFEIDAFAELEKNCREKSNLVTKLILLLIKKKTFSDEQIMSALKVSVNTYNKISSQAKDYLLEALEKNTSTPFDGIYVIQKLIFAGEIDFAQKLINEKEKYFEEKQLWMQLELLYIESSRIYYSTGNLQSSLKLGEKREKNSARLEKYIRLNSQIVSEMIRLEGFKNRTPDLKNYNHSLIRLTKAAMQLNHHVLIHNSLHLRYLFVSRYFQQAELVHEIISEMKKNAAKYEYAMNNLSKAIIKNTYLNFLTIYNGFGNPEDHVAEVKKNIHHAGKIAEANMCYAMLEYFLYKENIPKIMAWLKELEKLEDNSKFRQYKQIIFAIKAFLENDYASFKKYFSAFYSDASHLDFPDMEMNLRILELLVLSNKNENLVESKISSLKKYMSRNVNKDRYNEERKIVLHIEKMIYGNSDKKVNGLNQFSSSRYRNIVFLAESANRVLSELSRN